MPVRRDGAGGERTKPPFRIGSFGGSLWIAVLHPLPLESDRLAALTELRRVLRRRAPVFLSVWAREQPRFQSVLAAPEIDGDVEVPWPMPDKTRSGERRGGKEGRSRGAPYH